MPTQKPPLPSRVVIAMVVAIVLLWLATAEISIWQNWSDMTAADLPSPFWIIYAINIIAIIALFAVPKLFLQLRNNTTQPIFLFNAIIFSLFGLTQFIRIFTDSPLKGSTLLLGTFGAILTIFHIDVLIRYLRTRTKPTTKQL